MPSWCSRALPGEAMEKDDEGRATPRLHRSARWWERHRALDSTTGKGESVRGTTRGGEVLPCPSG